MTSRIRHSRLCIERTSLLVMCLLVAACSSGGGPGTARSLEQQAAAATSRPETMRSAARVEPTRDGRLAVVTDGWGRALPPPDLVAATPATAPVPVARPSAVAVTAQIVPAPAAPTPPVGNPEAAARKTLDEWRMAWARGDADAYLKFYDPQFKGTASTRTAWEAQRRKRLANRNIQLDFSDVRVLRAGADEADLRFVQHYRSAKHSDNGTKHVQLRRTAGEWKIVAEAWIHEERARSSLLRKAGKS